MAGADAGPTRSEVIAELTAPGGPAELREAVVRGVPLRVHVTSPQVLRDVHDGTAAHGDRAYTVYDGERVTYAEHRARVAALARRYDGIGLQRGDRIAICLRNYPEWAPLCWAAWVSGLVVVPLNAWWQSAELAHAVADAGPRLVVADGERAAVLREVTPDDVPVVVVRGEAPGCVPFAEFLGEVGDDRLPDVALDPEDDAFILYTSGTTGRPKGAVGTHRNLCTDVHNRRLTAALGARLTGVAPPAAPGVLLAFPIFHVAGLCGMVSSTAGGATIATLHRWDATAALRVIAAERLTSLAGVPTVARDLVRTAAGTPEADVSSLVGIGMGGAPIPPELVRRVAPVGAPSNGYGLTETTAGIAFNTGEDYLAAPDAVGRPVPSADVRVVDPATGTDLAEGAVGELWFRGPNVVRGYWNAPEATAAAFVDGWFRTGDLGRGGQTPKTRCDTRRRPAQGRRHPRRRERLLRRGRGRAAGGRGRPGRGGHRRPAPRARGGGGGRRRARPGRGARRGGAARAGRHPHRGLRRPDPDRDHHRAPAPQRRREGPQARPAGVAGTLEP
jgi:long-chain acyl-CoA synthetase